MFGFLNPVHHHKAYREVYSRCCQHLNLNYGLLSLPFLSYESIFLYLCVMDANPDAAPLPKQLCCRLRTSQKLRQAPDGEVGRFCSAFSLILAATKLEDDIRDGRSLAARFYYWLLKNRVATARQYFAAIDDGFGERIESFIRRHLAKEQGKPQVSLDDYTLPTAEAFGYIFGLMVHIPGVKADKSTLTVLGQQIGAALIAFDCAHDWKDDRATGQFNPLPNEAAIPSAIAFCQDKLTEAAQVCGGAFGNVSRTVKVLRAVRESIAASEPLSFRDTLRLTLEDWGILQPKGYVLLNECDLTQGFGSGCLGCLCLCAAAGAGCRKCTTCRHDVTVRQSNC